MKTRLLLARHGLTTWNALGRFQGQTDVPLSEIGQGQAAALGKRLASAQIDAIYASDLQRARATAEAIHSHHSCPLYVEPGLREMSFGQWEGLTYDEIQARDPDFLDRWQADMLNLAPPGGETLAQVAGRVKTVTGKITATHPEGNVLLVAHGGTLQVLLCQFLGLSPQAYWQFYLGPASLSDIRLYPQGAILNLFNDTCHLEAQT